MSLSVEVIRAIRQRQEYGLPQEIHDKVMLHIADTVGISLAAYKGAPIALQAISGISLGVEGGFGRVIGSRKLLPPAYAAFTNTALAHALDYDDINDNARIHPTPVTLAAALAAADIEKFRSTDLITAVGIGNELLCRFGYAIEPKGTGADSKWFLSQLFGYLGAAVTAGLVIGLDDDELVHALGLAYMQSAGGKEPGVGIGSQARSIYPAFASMGGVQAALLAKKGVTAPASCLDGKTGFFQNYFGKNLDEKQQRLLLDTDSWLFSDTSIKPYPSCRYSHLFIKSALELRKHFNFKDIDKIVIGVNETAKVLCHPMEDRVHPTTIQDAKFSIPFMVAFAFVHGSVNLNNITESALNDFRVINLAKRISLRNSHINSLGIPPGDIEIYSSGKVLMHSEDQVPQVTSEQVKIKFIECCQFAHIDNPELLYEMLIKNMDYGLVNILPIMSN